MPEPNPLWGVHAAPGAITGVLVERTDDGGFRVLATRVEEAPNDEAGVLAAATRFLQRRDVAGRAAHIALPDEDGTFLRAELTPEEQYLDDRELTAELFERTMFEPHQAQLVFRRLAAGAARDLLVAAVPREPAKRREAGVAALDPAFHGLALTGPCVLRGAQALGLTGDRTLLADVQPDQTVVTAVSRDDVRRYVLPAGRSALGTQADALAKDLVRLARYHVEQSAGRDNGREVADEDLPPIVLVGPGARASAPLLTRLPAAMTAHTVGPTRIRGKDGTPLPADEAHAAAIAIGAALEALGPPRDRLALRDPPTDVPEYIPPAGARRGLLWLATAAAIALGVIVWRVLPGGATPLSTEPAAEMATAIRAHLDLAARRRAFAETAALAADVAAAAPRGAADALQIEQSEGGYTLEMVVSCAPVALSATQARLAALPDVTVTRRGDDALVVRSETPMRPAPDAALAGRVIDAPPLGGTSMAFERWSVRGGQATGDRQIEQTLDAVEATLALRDAVAARAPPLRIALTAESDGRVRARLTDGSPPARPPSTTTLGADYLRAVSAAVTAVATRLGTSELISSGPAAPSAPPALLAAEGGEVRLRLPPGDDELLLERAAPGESRFSAVAEAAAGSELVDHVPGRSGTYRWRLRARDGPAGPELEATLTIPVRVEVVSVDPAAGAARLRLARSWKDGEVSAELDVAPGSAVRTTAARDGLEITLDTDFTIARIEAQSHPEQVPVTVPEFGPDGRVLRDASGEPRTRSGVRTRERAVPVVRAVDRAGAPVVWTAFEK